jgi:hypothetical protein
MQQYNIHEAKIIAKNCSTPARCNRIQWLINATHSNSINKNLSFGDEQLHKNMEQVLKKGYSGIDTLLTILVLVIIFMLLGLI